jgi:hypothetical protein
VAILLAAAHFECSISRAVLFLSGAPTAHLHAKLASVYGLDRYKDLWRDELVVPYRVRTLPQIVENWQPLQDAFTWRHRLIHGRDRCTGNMATAQVEAMLQAAAFVWDYCTKHGVSPITRWPGVAFYQTGDVSVSYSFAALMFAIPSLLKLLTRGRSRNPGFEVIPANGSLQRVSNGALV